MDKHICSKCRKPLVRSKKYGWTCEEHGGSWYLHTGKMWPMKEPEPD